MKSLTRRSRCAAIRAKCTDCTYDESAPGTQLQQITLCRVTDCALREFRPVTKSPIPAKVLKFFGVRPDDPVWNSIPGSDTAEKTRSERSNSAEQSFGTGEGCSA